MARKTFISYKYSDASEVRDRIIDALGEDATFYNGERSDSPDMSDKTTEAIKQNLKNMMYYTSVTIVVISPDVSKSEWVDWEIEYSLKRVQRAGRTSQTNGVVGVIKEVNGGYSWFKYTVTNNNCCSGVRYYDNYLYPIIKNNRFNQEPKEYTCSKCENVNPLTGSYISYVTEEDFLSDPKTYIENAYEKSKDNASGYNVAREK